MSYGHRIPTTISETLNTIAYPVELPIYAFEEHQAVKNGEIDRLFTPDKNAMCMSRICIADMIGFVERVVPFKIIGENDLIEIYQYLIKYMYELAKYPDNKEAAEYHIKCKEFQNKLTPSMNIYAKRNDKAAKLMFAFGDNAFMTTQIR